MSCVRDSDLMSLSLCLPLPQQPSVVASYLLVVPIYVATDVRNSRLVNTSSEGVGGGLPKVDQTPWVDGWTSRRRSEVLHTRAPHRSPVDQGPILQRRLASCQSGVCPGQRPHTPKGKKKIKKKNQ